MVLQSLLCRLGYHLAVFGRSEDVSTACTRCGTTLTSIQPYDLALEEVWPWVVAPGVDAGTWEYTKVPTKQSRYNTECPVCKHWFHECSNCSSVGWEEETFCSTECWVNAGKPEDPNGKEVKN